MLAINIIRTYYSSMESREILKHPNTPNPANTNGVAKPDLPDEINEALIANLEIDRSTEELLQTKYILSANGKNIVLSYRQAVLMGIAMTNEQVPLTADDFQAKGLLMGRTKVSFANIMEPLRERILTFGIGVLFEEKLNESGEKTYTFHPPSRHELILRRTEPNQKTKQRNEQKEKKLADLADPRPDYLKPDPSLVNQTGPWNDFRKRFTLMTINKDPSLTHSANLLKFASLLKQNLENPSAKKPTAREAGAIIQSYMLLNTEVPEEEDETAMELLDGVHGFLSKFIAHVMKTKTETAIDHFSRNLGGISPEISKGVRISTRDEIVELLRSMDLTRIHDNMEPEFDIKVEKMVQKNISKFYRAS